MLLTNKRLYNLKKDQMQRKILVNAITAITKSTKQGNIGFVVHVRSEYDYWFESDERLEIFDAIKHTCWKTNGKNLPVYGVPDSLKDYHTSKRDVTEGIVVIPKNEFRLKDEDIYPEGQMATPVMQKTSSNQPQGGYANTNDMEVAATTTQMNAEVA